MENFQKGKKVSSLDHFQVLHTLIKIIWKSPIHLFFLVLMTSISLLFAIHFLALYYPIAGLCSFIIFFTLGVIGAGSKELDINEKLSNPEERDTLIKKLKIIKEDNAN